MRRCFSQMFPTKPERGFIVRKLERFFQHEFIEDRMLGFFLRCIGKHFAKHAELIRKVFFVGDIRPGTECNSVGADVQAFDDLIDAALCHMDGADAWWVDCVFD